MCMRLILAAAWALLAGFGYAFADEPSAMKRLLTANDNKGWEAVGRLDIGRTGFCTGALIEADIVLTAAHCLFDPDTLTRVNATEIQFLAGWRNGSASAYRNVRSAVIHPSYKYTGPTGTDSVAYDVALLRLVQPIRKSSVRPFSVDARPRKGDEVGVVSYARNRDASPSIQEVCHVISRTFGSLILNCDVDFGSSGAPIFKIENGEARIVSVVSAKAEMRGQKVSLGTSVERVLPVLRKLLDENGNDVATDTRPRRAPHPDRRIGRRRQVRAAMIRALLILAMMMAGPVWAEKPGPAPAHPAPGPSGLGRRGPRRRGWRILHRRTDRARSGDDRGALRL